MTYSTEYNSWVSMLARCYNPKYDHYDRYGGRGISVCERWRTSFQNFLADMGLKPSSSHSIDRKDGDGNYEPGNCVWSDRYTQQQNRRMSKMITFRGETKCVAAWSRELGLSYGMVQRRLQIGYSVEDALTVPKGRRGVPRPGTPSK